MDMHDKIDKIHQLHITPCQYRVLELLVKTDLTEKQIANELCKTHGTIKKHSESLRRKLGTHTTRGATLKALQIGLFDLTEL